MVATRITFAAGREMAVIGEFHDAIEVTGLVVATDVQNLHQAFVGTGDRLVFLQAEKFAVKRLRGIKVVSPNNFYRAVSAHDAPGEPDFAICAASYATEKSVVRNLRRGARCVGRNGVIRT